MAVTQPNLTIELTQNSGCSGISLADTTGVYGVDGNTNGYGLPGSPSINDVTTVIVVLTYNSLGSYITYYFTLLNGVITACTLGIQGATPVDVFGALTSNVWPFTTILPFNLTGDYGITLPTFVDEIFTVDYTIEGVISGDEFIFGTTRSTTVLCNSRCCLDKKWTAIDPTCSCSNEAMSDAMLGESLYNKTIWSAEYNDLTGALEALNSLKRLCDESCGGCGC